MLDHEAPPGTDVAANSTLHRTGKAQLIREVTAAGVRLEAEGAFLHRPGDDHHLPIFDKADACKRLSTKGMARRPNP